MAKGISATMRTLAYYKKMGLPVLFRASLIEAKRVLLGIPRPLQSPYFR